MVFKRKVYDKLLEWKKLSAGASAVLLEGARRIGKSTIVEEFAKNEYDDYMILDFARENKDVRNNFILNPYLQISLPNAENYIILQIV